MFCFTSLMKSVRVKDTNSFNLFPRFSSVVLSPCFLGLALKDMEGREDERLCGKFRVACGLYSYNLRDVFTW